jgi:peptidoglycan/xylan/chitin deacetylase (PgdA/CDA1 family)
VKHFVRQTVKTLLTAALPPQRWLVRGPHRRLTDAPTISLTFDDGPHPEHTPRVLEELHRWNLTATFFVVGREVERHPELVTQIVDAGHALGNHTFSHSEPASTSAEQFLDEVCRTRELLRPWTIEPCRWVRPPKGDLTGRKLHGLWQTGHTVVLWNVDPRDYTLQNSADAEGWCRSRTPQHGDIVLLHDSGPMAAKIVTAWGRLGAFDRWRSVSIDRWLEPAKSEHLAGHP